MVLLLVPALQAHAEQSWQLVTNRHFEILSDAKTKVTLESAQELERFRAGCLALLKLPADGSIPRTRVIMFSLPRDRARYFVSRQAAAFVMPWRDTSILAMAPKYTTLRAAYVARHEVVHTLSVHVPGRRPRWFEEGIAEVLAISQFDPNGERFQFGLPNDRMRAERAADYPKLDERLLDPSAKPFYVTGDPYWFYWLLTHYLTLGPAERNADLVQYLDMFSNGMDHTQAFRAAFGTTPRAMWEDEIIPYMAAIPSAVVRLDPATLDDRFEVVPAPPAMLDETLAALLAFKAQATDAKAHGER